MPPKSLSKCNWFCIEITSNPMAYEVVCSSKYWVVCFDYQVQCSFPRACTFFIHRFDCANTKRQTNLRSLFRRIWNWIKWQQSSDSKYYNLITSSIRVVCESSFLLLLFFCFVLFLSLLLLFLCVIGAKNARDNSIGPILQFISISVKCKSFAD